MLSFFATSTLVFLAVTCAAQELVLDDTNGTLDISTRNAVAGGLQACEKDAYGGQVHHDSGLNKGHASFTFAFDVPRSGCYRVEERHPGEEWTCRNVLPQRVRVDVDYCKGLSATTYINQAREGAHGRWNQMGLWMFYTGFPGALTIRNSAEEQCGARVPQHLGRSSPAYRGQCVWVVDAFRLTWVGEDCLGAAAPVEDSTTAAMETPAEAAAAEYGMLEREGVLTFRVAGPASSDVAESILKSEGSQYAVAAALELNFGLEHVRVLSIEAQGRRLSSGEPSSSFAFDARFAGNSSNAEVRSGGDLAAALQASLDETGASVKVTSASVVWTAQFTWGFRSKSTDEGCQDGCHQPASHLPWVLLGGGVVGVSLFWTIACFVHSRCNQCKQDEASGSGEVEGGGSGADRPDSVVVWELDRAVAQPSASDISASETPAGETPASETPARAGAEE